jgi:hypothetical protein
LTGPKVSPSVTVFLIAVPIAFIVSNTPTFPHQSGTSTPGNVMAKKITNVAMISPESNAAAVI